MNREDFPNELDSDYLLLLAKFSSLLDQMVLLGEEKARVTIFATIRELLTEKDMAGDEIAAEVINWVWSELATRYQISAANEYKYWPPKNFRDIANGE